MYRDSRSDTLRASLSGTFLQTLPDLKEGCRKPVLEFEEVKEWGVGCESGRRMGTGKGSWVVGEGLELGGGGGGGVGGVGVEVQLFYKPAFCSCVVVRHG